MRTRTSAFTTVLIGFLFVFTAFGQQPNASSKLTTPADQRTEASATKPTKAVTSEQIEQDISEALTVIENNHVSGKKLDYNEVMKDSIDSMLHTLDPHSNYFDAKEFEQFRTDQSSRYYGIGATIGDLSDEKGNVVATYIKATFENAPANRAGLRYGDKIVEVNGVNVLGKPFTEVRNLLRGPRGTLARLKVEHYGTGQQETVDIIRDAVPQPSISEAYMIRPGVGYINMSGGFNQTTYAEFSDAMKQLKAQGMQQLVIDLRNNGGGLVGQAYRVANTFLSTGQTVFTQKGRLGGTTESYRAENENPDKTPIVMLVNRGTASASEILTGALQDHDRALIVGENTFGKGLVQNPFLLDYGTMLLLTIAKYETPSGRLIQRDYSNGNLYDYYTNGGIGSDDSTREPSRGPASKTDSGRDVYSGGGINPDVVVKPDTIPNERFRTQSKLVSPIFAFALDLAYGKASGFDTYKVGKPISFDYDIKANDFAVTDTLYQSFKKFAVDKYKYNPAIIDKEKEFVERTLRSELVTAAYGTQTSFQVTNEYDNQLQKAIELLPQAKQLALAGARANAAAATRGRTANR
ncbi:MAG TPA: S41 family peptidase [Pyrinomonadaceae bacterium]|nr:S41 family peptidase [Pyrinomonadaceae bacterium]